jgi:NAD(P)-dependent dehydrogenase (short-subunit alcohol dehydrogenase family)
MAQEGLQPLQGKVVLVTGASRGIGAAAAMRLAQAGASVVVNYHQNRDAAQRVLNEIERSSGRGMIFQADVTRKDQVASMVRAAQEKFSAIDVLVNNAYFPFEVGQRSTSCPGRVFIARSTMSWRRFASLRTGLRAGDDRKKIR